MIDTIQNTATTPSNFGCSQTRLEAFSWQHQIQLATGTRGLLLAHRLVLGRVFGRDRPASQPGAACGPWSASATAGAHAGSGRPGPSTGASLLVTARAPHVPLAVRSVGPLPTVPEVDPAENWLRRRGHDCSFGFSRLVLLGPHDRAHLVREVETELGNVMVSSTAPLTYSRYALAHGPVRLI